VPDVDSPAWHFAEYNIARLHHPLDHPASAEFVANLDHVNAIAEASPGFVWRLTDESGLSSSYVRAYDDPLTIINMSVWESPELFQEFVYRSDHTAFLRRRREWFEKPSEAYFVCWWIPVGQVPSVEEAVGRLDRLRRDGASDDAFTLRELRPAPRAPAVR
jgi:heme-degrading monooxygenase HmoA